MLVIMEQKVPTSCMTKVISNSQLRYDQSHFLGEIQNSKFKIQSPTEEPFKSHQTFVGEYENPALIMQVKCEIA
jgi:hypothetical protein